MQPLDQYGNGTGAASGRRGTCGKKENAGEKKSESESEEESEPATLDFLVIWARCVYDLKIPPDFVGRLTLAQIHELFKRNEIDYWLNNVQVAGVRATLINLWSKTKARAEDFIGKCPIKQKVKRADRDSIRSAFEVIFPRPEAIEEEKRKRKERSLKRKRGEL